MADVRSKTGAALLSDFSGSVGTPIVVNQTTGDLAVLTTGDVIQLIKGAGVLTASEVVNVPAGNIAATNVQAALNELDTEKAPAASKLSTYSWNPWNPSSLIATPTNAPAAGTNYDSLFTTNANSAGTLTITFDIAGVYLVHLLLQATHANLYSQEILNAVLGGTAARVIGTAPRYSGDTASDSSGGATITFRCSATVGQTLTILPVYYLTGTGVITDHTAYAQVNIEYCGF